jgi:hypothetical protein
MELNFAQDNDLGGDSGGTASLDDGSVMSRGNKAFIEEMKNRKKEANQPTGDINNIDPDNLPTGWKIDEETGEIYDDDTGEVMGKINDIKKP